MIRRHRRVSVFFLYLFMVMGTFVFSAQGQSVNWGASSGHSGLTALFAVVTDEGRVLIYHTENPKLATELVEGKKYRVFYKGKEAGTIEIAEVKATYSTAIVVAGKLNLNLEGKTLELVDFTHEYIVTPDEIKSDLKTLKVRNVIPDEPKHGGMADMPENGPETKQSAKTEKKKAKKRTEKKTIIRTESDTGEEKSSGTSSRRSSREQGAADEDERGSVAVAVQTKAPSGKSAGESIDVATKNKKKAKAINNLQFRYESHNGNSNLVDSVFTAVVSSTRVHNETLITLFGIHSASENEDDENDRSTTVGISYTRFFQSTEYCSASYSLPLNNDDDESTRGSFFFSYNWIMGMRGDRTENSYYRLTSSYATKENFDEGKSGAIGLDYYRNLKNKTKWKAGYDYIYSFDVDEHLYNQYSLEYTFLWRKQEKVTLGYKHIEREYGTADGDDDNDEVFRAVYSITY